MACPPSAMGYVFMIESWASLSKTMFIFFIKVRKLQLDFICYINPMPCTINPNLGLNTFFLGLNNDRFAKLWSKCCFFFAFFDELENNITNL